MAEKKKPTQEEIIQEVGEISSNWNQDDKPAMQDPIVWREDYKTEDIINGRDPKLIKNGSMNKDAYGDDGNGVNNVDIPEMYGGKNDKYMGEGTRNTFEAYDPNLTTAGLDPNYKYGVNARMANSAEANYIARRNDMIASALYNEGRTSMQDVADFLNAQEGFRNSTEGERQNTIASIWKRIGEKGQEGEKEEAKKEEPDLSKAEDIISDTSGKLYGKTTANGGDPVEGINTLSDANSIFKSMEQDRVRGLTNLVQMGPELIAASMSEGINPEGEQGWRDLQQYYPEIAAEVKTIMKRKKAQDTANAIASGKDLPDTTNGSSTSNNDIADFSTKNATSIKSSAEITKDVHNYMAENQTANEASELMATIEEDMATLKNRMKNLRAEVTADFKGDVPDYIVNAAMNNRSQEIQNQMAILEDRYNAAYNRYKTELANTQWEMEYKLKQEELELKKDSLALEKYKAENGTKGTSTTDGNKTVKGNTGKDLQITSLSRTQVGEKVDDLLDMLKAGQLGDAQCAAGIQKYYLPMLGISLGTLSNWDDKQALINEGEDYVPQKGDLMIMSSQTAPKYGHIAIVTGVDENGNIHYLDWNGSLDANGNGTEKPQERIINADSKTIKGFYNATKGQGESSTAQWTDYDYSNFEKFLDPDTNQTTIKAIAAKYGLSDNPELLTPIAIDALNSRNAAQTTANVNTTNTQGTERTVVKDENGNEITYAPGITETYKFINEIGFDPELGFNPGLRKIYEAYLKNEKMNNQGGRTDEQLQIEAMNYANARDRGYDAFNTGKRVIDEQLGFDPESSEIYATIIANGYKIPGTQQDYILSSLGLDPDDPTAPEKAKNEARKFSEWNKANLANQDLQDMLTAIEYIIAQDATKPQRTAWWKIGEGDTWETYYDYIKTKLTLDYFMDIKKGGATFGNLSDQELKIIGMAASVIDKSQDSDSFRTNINNLYNTVRETLGRDRLSAAELNEMWNIEDGGKNAKWDNFLMLDHSHKTGLFGGYNYRTYNGKDYKEGTTGYNQYGPNRLAEAREAFNNAINNMWNSGDDDANNRIN